jgi:hypothetical protein
MAKRYRFASMWNGGDKFIADETYVLAANYDALAVELALQKEALAWVIDNFNTFKQPPSHLNAIIDEACLKAMAADADAVALTAETSAEPSCEGCASAVPVARVGNVVCHLYETGGAKRCTAKIAPETGVQPEKCPHGVLWRGPVCMDCVNEAFGYQSKTGEKHG